MTMEIKLMNITLNNFKGIKELVVKADGENINIYGANESGKTSVADAYYWLLFNKDSNNAADFGIKTLVDGKEQHGLEHTVTAEFLIDSKPVSLEKTYKEEWKKKRGQTNAEFTGHKTTYKINEVPKNKTTFNEYINTIISDENLFRLVSDAYYFNSLKTDKKREILMGIAGEVSDQSVIDSNPDLKPLEQHLINYTVEELRAKNKHDRTAINKKLEENPIRIDELTKGINDNGIEETPEELNQSLESHKEGIKALEDATMKVRTGERLKAVNDGLKTIFDIEEKDLAKVISQTEADIEKYISNYDNDSQKQLEQLKYATDYEQSNLDLLARQRSNKEQDLGLQQRKLDNLREDHKHLATRLKEVEAENKTFDIETVCNCCGQDLPADKVAEHRETQQKEYNDKRAATIEGIKQSITSLIAKGKAEAAAIPDYEKEIEKINLNIEKIEKVVKRNKERISELSEKVTDPKDTPEYKRLEERLRLTKDALANLNSELKINHEEFKALSDELETLEKNKEEVEAKAQDDIKTLREKINQIDSKLMQLKSIENDKNRINILLAEQEKLADEYEKLEHIENMLNVFVTSKVKLLEDSISNQFKHARFNLFEPLINGGLKEICETTYKGVPYHKGLNTAGKITVGIDIINTLANHYDLKVPVIIDNAESISDIPETNSQQVRLFVSAENKILKIEGDK